MTLLLCYLAAVYIFTSHLTTAEKNHICRPSGPTRTQLPRRYATCKLDIETGLYQPVEVKTTKETLELHRYPYEEFEVRTKDFYLLRIYRITGSPKRGENVTYDREKLPVFLNHGLIASSDWWFIQPGGKNLPFILADAGYDVWLGNSRGSIYSLGHEFLNYELDLDYWDFSFHEIGIYDVPAVTSTILEKTGHSKLHYVGYSMGTTQIFIGLSELPELNSKIQAGYLLAPIAYMGHCTTPIRHFSKVFGTEAGFKASSRFSQGRFKGYSEIREVLNVTTVDVCCDTAVKCGMCDNAYFALFGYNAVQMNGSHLLMSKLVNSGSWKTLSHYSQLIHSCRFQKYSYTRARNMHTYKSVHPPEYDLKAITTPLYFYHANLDNFGIPKDVRITASHLRNGVLQRMFKVNDYLFNHMDFAMAKDGDTLVYNHVLADIEKFDQIREAV